MKNIIYKLISYLPTRQGKERLQNLINYINKDPIKFSVEKITEDGQSYFLATSFNIPKGNIITSGKNLEELNNNIKDAIFTSFDVPAYYCDYSLIKEQAEIKELKYATI